MGKGKLDRTRSNATRRRRKRRIYKFLSHLVKHPDYYNKNNPIPFESLGITVIFYMLILCALCKSKANP